MVSWNYYETTDTDKNKSFVDAYKTMFGQDRVTSDPAGAAYDAVYLWKAACEKAGSFEVDDVLDAIHTGEISFDASEGTVIINGENQAPCQSRFASVRLPMTADLTRYIPPTVRSIPIRTSRVMTGQ